LKEAIEEAAPGQFQVSGAPGRRSSFEVTVGTDESNKVVLFSKLKSGKFPDRDSMAEALEAYAKNGEVKEVAPAQGGGCTVQ